MTTGNITPPRIYQGLVLVAILCASLLSACSEDQPNVTDQEDSGVAATTPDGPAGADQPKSDPAESKQQPILGTASYLARTDINEQALGVPIYPGAVALTGVTWSMSEQVSEGADSHTSVSLQTSDPIAKVTEFYKDRLKPDPAQFFQFENDKGKTVSLTQHTSEYASSNITLRERDTGTRIDINIMGTEPDRVR